MLTLKLLSLLHILGAVVFVGSNVLMARVVKRLAAIPPREAARMSELLGADMTILNWAALAILGGTGLWRIGKTDLFDDLFTWGFVSSAYGSALVAMTVLWLVVVVSAALMTFYFTPRLSIKLPYDASRQVIEKGAESTMASAAWIARLSHFNLFAGLVTVLVAGFLRYGGFTVTTAGAAPAKPTPAAALEGDAARGKGSFDSSGCAGCHTLATMARPERDAALAQVTNGGRGMPAFAKAKGGALTDQQIADVVAYVVEAAGR